MYILQVSLHTSKRCKFFTTQGTGLFKFIGLSPLLMNFSDVSLDFLLRLKTLATSFTEGRLLTVRFHVTVEVMRVSVALTTLVTDVNLVGRVVGPLLVVVERLVVLEFQFADITGHVEIFGIM